MAAGSLSAPGRGGAAVFPLSGRALVGVCLVLAALSLLVPWSLAFDPQAWVVWGRDVLRLELDTSSGPSWKPLPVLVTAPLAATGDAAPALWLVFARTGALLAVAGAAAVAARLGGGLAAVGAAAVMALSPWWAYNAALGNSEGLLTAAILWAVVAHLDGRWRAALALAACAALLRPEVWPFFAAYCIWLWRGDHVRRSIVAAAAVTVPLLWLGPDVLGIGGAVSASRAARGEPSPGSAGLEDVPGLAVLADAATRLTVPGTIAAFAGAVLGPRPARFLAAAAATWVALVAVMAQAGYAGNPRYLVTAAAVGCALAGVGAARAGTIAGAAYARRARAGDRADGSSGTTAGAVTDGSSGATRAGAVTDGSSGAPSPGGPARGAAVAVAALIVAAAVLAVPYFRDQEEELGVRADRRAALSQLVAAAGGRDALVGCSRVRTWDDVRPLVAWELDLPMLDLDEIPVRPAVVLRARPHDGGPVEPRMQPARAGYRLVARAPGWEAWAACGRAPQTSD